MSHKNGIPTNHKGVHFPSWLEGANYRLLALGTFATLVIAVIAVLGFVVPRLPGSPELQIVNVAATDGDSVTSNTAPTISVVIRNSGSQDALLVRAQVRVLEAVHLRTCYTGGDIPDGGSFDVKLPKPGGDRQVVIDDLHQQISKGKAGRFTLRFSSADLPVPGRNDFGPGSYMYRLDVKLIGPEGEQDPLKTPPVILVAPVSSAAVNQVVPASRILENASSAFGVDLQGAATAAVCYKENDRLFSRIVSKGGIMPPAIRTASNELIKGK